MSTESCRWKVAVVIHLGFRDECRQDLDEGGRCRGSPRFRLRVLVPGASHLGHPGFLEHAARGLPRTCRPQSAPNVPPGACLRRRRSRTAPDNVGRRLPLAPGRQQVKSGGTFKRDMGRAARATRVLSEEVRRQPVGPGNLHRDAPPFDPGIHLCPRDRRSRARARAWPTRTAVAVASRVI